MRINNFLILPLLVFSFVSCVAKKTVTDLNIQDTKFNINVLNDKDVKQDVRLLHKVTYNSISQKTIVADLDFSLNIEQKQINLPAKLKMYRDKVIRLQLLLPFIRTEVARIEFTKDYVLFLDRIHKEYVKANYEDISFLRNNGINFYSLQSLFWNQLFLPSKQSITEKDLKCFSVNTDPNKSKDEIFLQDGKMDYHWFLSKETAFITNVEIKYNSGQYGMSMLSSKYSNFRSFGSKKYPLTHELYFETTATKTKKKVNLIFDLDKPSDKADWELFTEPSSRYKKVSVEEILAKIADI